MSTDPVKELYDQLDQEIQQELERATIPAHWHGRPVGYNNGCKGPLCTAIQRNRTRVHSKAVSINPIKDAYLLAKITEYQQSLKNTGGAA